MALRGKIGTFINSLAAAISLSLCAFAPPSVAQTEANHIGVEASQLQAPIRVSSSLVVVHVQVVDKRGLSSKKSQAEKDCDISGLEAYRRLGPAQPFLPPNCYVAEVRNLSATDFHVLVDGKEQKIERVLTEDDEVNVRDNFGRHDEHSESGTGKWSTADLPGVRGTRNGTTHLQHRLRPV